ncbi:MAG: archease [Actinobacteria bacterium]|nr:archease [Actinomycetota bacterium]
MQQPYETINHTADVGLKASGVTLAEAFENAATGMFSLISDLENVGSGAALDVYVEAEDRETLLVEWLNELLYLFEVDHWIFKHFRIEDTDGEHYLRAKAFGEELDLGRHQIKIQIKAVTYHMLKVEHDDRWIAQVIFDV